MEQQALLKRCPLGTHRDDRADHVPHERRPHRRARDALSRILRVLSVRLLRGGGDGAFDDAGDVAEGVIEIEEGGQLFG